MEIADIKKLTPYPDINNVLVMLTQGVQEILGNELVGLYLTGSLTYGDFLTESSDIDFLAITKNKLSDDQLERIKDLHKHIGESNPKWHKRIEGSYITKKMLKSEQPPKTPRPYVNEGNFHSFLYGNEWILNLYVLYESGIALLGPNPKVIIKPVRIKSVREASRKDLFEEWEPKLKDESFFQNSHYKAYVILTMCRILYRATHEDVASKKVASVWAKKTYPQWEKLIEKAENWQHGQELGLTDETKDFIKFVVAQISGS